MTVKKLSKVIHLPKSNNGNEIFWNVLLCYPYLLEISSKIEGKRGHLVFLALKFSSLTVSFEIFDIYMKEKSFFTLHVLEEEKR